MSWADRFPVPASKPARPVGEEPAASLDFNAWSKWCRTRSEWNEYVRAFRRHEIAQAVDDLILFRATRPLIFTSAHVVVLHAGMNLLDADGDKSVMSENGE